MSTRKFKNFYTEGFYHIYNRGIDKRSVFEDKQDFFQFLQMIDLFNLNESLGGTKIYKYPKNLKHRGKTSMLVEVVAFCLLPNHYHLILKQIADNGISKFMQKIGTGYTMYFNQKNKRTGSLFQGKFKAIHIDNQGYLDYLSVYVNLNYKVHKIKENKNNQEQNYRTSFFEYIEKTNTNFCSKKHILNSFRNPEEYNKFANRQLINILENKLEKKQNEFK